MKKIKPYILPIALVLGLFMHTWVASIAFLVPYVIFSILLLNFCAVDLKSLRFNRLDLMIMAFQTVVSVSLYLALRALGCGETLAQSALICVLCPVASSVVVISSELGADRRTTTGYTIFGNLLVAALAPVYFSFIGLHQDMPFWESVMLIFNKVAPIIALPYFIVLALQLWLPKVKTALSRLKEWALPLWALALLITLGETIDYIFLYHEGNEQTIVWSGVMSLVICASQFAIGKWMGWRRGEKVAGGQLLGQKNTALGIWMATVYLNPLSSVVLAFYSIFQNLYNSWQMWHHTRKKTQVAALHR